MGDESIICTTLREHIKKYVNIMSNRGQTLVICSFFCTYYFYVLFLTSLMYFQRPRPTKDINELTSAVFRRILTTVDVSFQGRLNVIDVLRTSTNNLTQGMLH